MKGKTVKLFFVSIHRSEVPQEPLTAPDMASAADLYIQDILAGKSEVTSSDLRRSAYVDICELLPRAEGGLMICGEDASFKLESIPSWKAYLEERETSLPGGP